MYYVLLAVIAILLFLLRKRILGGIVGVISLVLVIGLTIFLLDFFWLGKGYDGEDRDVRKFEPTQEVVEQYDETIKDPVQKAQNIGDTITEKGTNVNESLKETGSKLDEQLGIQKDSSNNNLWGSSEEEEGDSNQEQELEESEKEEEGILSGIFGSKDNSEEEDETVKENTNQENSKLLFDQLGRAESAWGLGKEDARFVKSASPFNLGEFSNGNITIEVVEDGVILK